VLTALKEVQAGVKRRSTLMVSPVQIQKTSSEAKERSWNLRPVSVFLKYAQQLGWRSNYSICPCSHMLRPSPVQRCQSPRDRSVSQHLQTPQGPAVQYVTGVTYRWW